MAKKAFLGIDVGSTTVKAVLLPAKNVDDKPLFADYRRHNADVRAELLKLLKDITVDCPDVEVVSAVTGSGGMQVAEILDIPFVQEVIAETEATRLAHPETDVIIELGGEDAKITYLHPTPEQRMNGTCAGGTGAFIDQMATLLHTDASGLNELAAQHTQLYPIASRCGVFAKTDLQPLINEGAAHEDLAASVFQAVATQTIAGLANGRPVKGNVLFLGGPLHFLPELREAYKRLLDRVDTFTTPDNAQLYVALGAALLAQGQSRRIDDLVFELEHAPTNLTQSHRLRALFANEQERKDFNERHSKAHIDTVDISQAKGKCFLGIDAGSTTIKAVLIDEDNRICFTHYAPNEGDPVHAAIEIVKNLSRALTDGTRVAWSCSTGYGEGLVQSALGVDEGEIETMAHFRAADYIAPGVTSVIDIGGQDMKYLKIKDGVVDSIAVNEACSSGCGSFLQTFAHTMNMSVENFASAATKAHAPVDLGTRCTVFMNSSVKQAQKEGADVDDISAGLSYSVVRNALYKVIKLKDASELGSKVVVQGGTFLNDAVLRAFELLTDTEVIRPNIAGLMGAYGAALTARSHYERMVEAGEDPQTSLLTPEQLDNLSMETERKTCRLCQNHCQMTITKFSSGVRHVSGNRCERGASLEKVPPKSPLPNLYDWKYKRTFGYRRLKEKDAIRGDIGVPRVLNMYQDYPFWFTVLTQLKFRVMISGRSNHELFESGMESIPSENVCYPAKLVHGHIKSLLDKGITTIFYPCVSYEENLTDVQDNCYNCPVVATYPEVIRNNMEELESPDVNFMSPFINLSADRDHLAGRLVDIFAKWNVTKDEARAALDAAFDEADAYRQEIQDKGDEALQYMEDHDVRGIVLAGRPYHLDPEINHGIPQLINGLGMAVLTEDSIARDGHMTKPLRVRNQWSYHSRLYHAAARAGLLKRAEIVQLISFGCGLDAVTAEQVQEILEDQNEVYTALKIDEVSNLGAARIRLRSLAAAVDERSSSAMEAEQIDTTVAPAPARGDSGAAPSYDKPFPVFTEEMRDAGYTILAPQMAPIQFRMIAPIAHKFGYNMVLLERASKDDIETGLKYVNNDACYPAIIVIGQLIGAFTSGRYDPDTSAVLITQTGGMCRATNYAGLLRKGLADAGYPQIPVVAVSAQGLEENPGFKLTLPLVHNVIKAIYLGDLLQKLVLRTRPYEAEPGSVQALYEKWDAICRRYFGPQWENEGIDSFGHDSGDHSGALSVGERLGYTLSDDVWKSYGKLNYRKIIRHMVAEFDALPLRDIPRRPRVGLVGEILVKFQPDANNNAVSVIEDEGCEAVLPGLAQFFLYGLQTIDWNAANLGTETGWSGRMEKMARWAIEQYQKPITTALEKTNGKFEPDVPMAELAEKASQVVQLGAQAGEGWYLTAEMMEMIESGTPNIICVQPFACLPNHIVGKGMFRPLRQRYPEANIVGIDYDPGASEVNQLNRIKLMISTAYLNSSGGQLGKFEDGDEFDERFDIDNFVNQDATGGGCGCGSCGFGDSSAPGSAAPVNLGIPSLRRFR